MWGWHMSHICNPSCTCSDTLSLRFTRAILPRKHAQNKKVGCQGDKMLYICNTSCTCCDTLSLCFTRAILPHRSAQKRVVGCEGDTCYTYVIHHVHVLTPYLFALRGRYCHVDLHKRGGQGVRVRGYHMYVYYVYILTPYHMAQHLRLWEVKWQIRMGIGCQGDRVSHVFTLCIYVLTPCHHIPTFSEGGTSTYLYSKERSRMLGWRDITHMWDIRTCFHTFRACSDTLSLHFQRETPLRKFIFLCFYGE